MYFSKYVFLSLHILSFQGHTEFCDIVLFLKCVQGVMDLDDMCTGLYFWAYTKVFYTLK